MLFHHFNIIDTIQQSVWSIW